MVTDRPYRKALARDEAVARLRKSAGSQFDPAIVDAFVALLEADQVPAVSADLPDA
jgi:HD-GYP domain-containing protein (c-di-GMP phosphodiesterase class II)